MIKVDCDICCNENILEPDDITVLHAFQYWGWQYSCAFQCPSCGVRRQIKLTYALFENLIEQGCEVREWEPPVVEIGDGPAISETDVEDFIRALAVI